VDMDLSVAEVRDLLPYLTPAERAELDAILVADMARVLWRPLPGPQRMAYESQADITGYGGAAGGGKTDLAVGLTLTAHDRTLFMRREKAQSEGFVQRLAEVLGNTEGYNSQKGFWRLPGGRLCEVGGLDNPGDENRWRGRPHDLIVLDEATELREHQARFVLGWNRTTKAGQRCRVLMTFNPPTTVEGRWVVEYFAPWLDPKHPHPAKPGELRWFAVIDGKEVEVEGGAPFAHNGETIVPRSRTFIPSRIADNPFLMGTGYESVLQSLPEPLRSQMLYGDFNAGIEDDPWQVIPTAWVEAAQARWKRPDRLAPMDSLGLDVARGGRDKTILARRHGWWFDEPLVYPGKDTPDGPTVAGLAISALRDHAVIHLDVIGVGASPYDFLVTAKQQVVGVNVAEAACGTDKSGRLRFFNRRSELWWRMREALDPIHNTGIALPPDPRLLADLTAPTWSLSGATLKVASREDIIDKIGRSPDFGSAYVLALMDTPKRAAVEALGQARSRLDYDPYARM
ncbi:Putative phage terminase large subunit, partial [Bordetella avium 197N]